MRQAEEEAQRQAEEEAMRQAEEEEARRQAEEEEAQRLAEEEAQRQAEEEEARRQAEEEEAQRLAEEEAQRQAEEEANKTQTINGTVTSISGSSMQVRAEGCSITVLIGGADMNVQDSIQEGDEVTVVIKGQMTDNGWNAISVTDQVSHS